MMQLALLKGLALLLALIPLGHAQSGWKPHKAVEIIVGTSPGGGQDRSARAVQRLIDGKRLIDVPSNVVNKPGAGSALGYAYLNQHPGDAHYLMLSTTPLITNPITGLQKITHEDLTPIALLFEEYIVASVAASAPIKDGKDLLARLKKDPASASLGVSSVAGGANHVAAGLVFKTAGIDVKKIRTVVFDSAGKVMTATLGGHVDLASTSITAALRQVQAGKVRVLGVSAPRRLGGDMAQFPTWREQGAEVDFSNYRGVIGPKGLSAAQVAYWEGVLAALDRDDSWRAHLEKTQLDRQLMTGKETLKYQDELDGKLRAVLGDLGLLKSLAGS